jgi:hypothetical protein
MFAHIYLNSPDCKYENDDDGTCLLSFLSFRYHKDNGIILHVAKMDYFFCRGEEKWKPILRCHAKREAVNGETDNRLCCILKNLKNRRK